MENKTSRINEIAEKIKSFARENFGGRHLNISQTVWDDLAKFLVDSGVVGEELDEEEVKGFNSALEKCKVAYAKAREER